MKKSIILLLVLVGFLGAVCSSNQTGVVRCDESKLEWQDDNDVDMISWKTWKEALEYCENLNLANYNDWRLPNINELKSIVDRSTSRPALIYGFNHKNINFFWSSSTYELVPQNARIVDFSNGQDLDKLKSSRHSVRCVR